MDESSTLLHSHVCTQRKFSCQMAWGVANRMYGYRAYARAQFSNQRAGFKSIGDHLTCLHRFSLDRCRFTATIALHCITRCRAGQTTLSNTVRRRVGAPFDLYHRSPQPHPLACATANCRTYTIGCAHCASDANVSGLSGRRTGKRNRFQANDASCNLVEGMSRHHMFLIVDQFSGRAIEFPLQ
jgi:hypothetical protein